MFAEYLLPIFVTAQIDPDRPAFGLQDRVITYRQLVGHILSTEAAISDLDLSPDSPVGICIPHPVPHLIVALALMKSGFATTSLVPALFQQAASLSVRDIITSASAPDCEIRQHVFDDKWMARNGINFAWTPRATDPNRVSRVSFTSGSTGQKKAVAHSERALVRSIETETFWKAGSETAVLLQFGFGSLVGFDLFIGLLRLGRMICWAGTADVCLKLIPKYQIGLIIGSTGQMLELTSLQRKARLDMRSVRRISTGGGPVSATQIADLAIVFGAQVEDVYASTEAGTAGIAAGPLLKNRAQFGSRFQILSDIKVVDPEAGSDAREGLIWVRSDSMGFSFTGEMMAPDQAEEWFCPGDLGRIDPGGCLVLTGRADSLLNFGGVKIAPEEIEAILAQHEAVSDVAVVRIDDGKGGVKIVAAVVAQTPLKLAELNAVLKSAKLAFRLDEIVNVPEIARGESGKIARADMRRLVARA